MTEKAMTAGEQARRAIRRNDFATLAEFEDALLRMEKALDAHARAVWRETVERACAELCRECHDRDGLPHSDECERLRAAFPEEGDR